MGPTFARVAFAAFLFSLEPSSNVIAALVACRLLILVGSCGCARLAQLDMYGNGLKDTLALDIRFFGFKVVRLLYLSPACGARRLGIQGYAWLGRGLRLTLASDIRFFGFRDVRLLYLSPACGARRLGI